MRMSVDTTHIRSLAVSAVANGVTLPEDLRARLAAKLADQAVRLQVEAQQLQYFRDPHCLNSLIVALDIQPLRNRDDFQSPLENTRSH